MDVDIHAQLKAHCSCSSSCSASTDRPRTESSPSDAFHLTKKAQRTDSILNTDSEHLENRNLLVGTLRSTLMSGDLDEVLNSPGVSVFAKALLKPLIISYIILKPGIDNPSCLPHHCKIK